MHACVDAWMHAMHACMPPARVHPPGAARAWHVGMHVGRRVFTRFTPKPHMVDTAYVSPTVLTKAIFENFAGHSLFMGDI